MSIKKIALNGIVPSISVFSGHSVRIFMSLKLCLQWSVETWEVQAIVLPVGSYSVIVNTHMIFNDSVS
jgi:hypothetical protein